MLPENDSDVLAVAATRIKTEKPSLYRVMLHNDDYTTMEFVVYILEAVFHKGETDAVQIMLRVHVQGVGVAGVFTREVAEMKVAKTIALAQSHDYPLLCTMEPE